MRRITSAPGLAWLPGVLTRALLSACRPTAEGLGLCYNLITDEQISGSIGQEECRHECDSSGISASQYYWVNTSVGNTLTGPG